MPTIMDLGGDWRYRLDPEDRGRELEYFAPACDVSEWGTMRIPNNWYLTEAGDYFGAVWFRKEFRVPDGWDGMKIILRFHAVDYFADVWLNGVYLGHHEGYFTPFEFHVTSYLNEGTNTLVVLDGAPRDSTEYVPVPGENEKSNPLSSKYRRHWAKALTLIKGHHIDAMHRPGSMTQFRSDGNSGGIWQTVELEACGPVRITKKKVYCKLVERDGSALVSVELTAENATTRMIAVPVELNVSPANFDGGCVQTRRRDAELQPGANEIRLVLTIDSPMLWNTWDHGFPHLYQADVSLGEEARTSVRFGIKEFTHDADSSHFFLNGKKIFLRGMRYFSSHWLSEMNDERYREDLLKMRELNINSIRIGSHVEKDGFYSLCDELGILVWQVFPLHYCVSDSDEMIEKCAPMMKQMVELLYNHACIGCWSVFKEPEVYALPDAPNNYGRLCQIMLEAGKSADPIRWMHTGDYREHVQNLTVGQCHPWDWDMRKAPVEPIIVEFGCGTFVSEESMHRALPGKQLWPPDWDEWEYYNAFYDITFHTAGLHMTATLGEFIDQAQSYQARCIKEQIEFCRQKKYQPVGSMYLYYWNEPWTNLGASGLMDYYRKPFPSYAAFRKVYTPVLVSFEWDKSPYILGKQKVYAPESSFAGNLWVTNDRFEPIGNAQLHWSIRPTWEQEAAAQGSTTFAVPDDCSRIVDSILWEIPAEQACGEYILEMDVTDANGQLLSRNDFPFEITR